MCLGEGECIDWCPTCLGTEPYCKWCGGEWEIMGTCRTCDGAGQVDCPDCPEPTILDLILEAVDEVD